MKRYQFTEEQRLEIKEARSKNRDKKIDKRLHALELRAEGKSNKEITEITGFHTQYITVLVSKYRNKGLGAVIDNHYQGNHRNLSFEEEAKLLEPFKKEAEKGNLVSVKEIEKAYCKAVGHSIGTSQIYYVLHRHGWRKVMPRSRHPKKSSNEVIEASKKLITEFAN